MSQQKILERVLEMVKELVNTDEVTDEVTAESSLMEDLEMESLDAFSLLGRVEREFHVRIAEHYLSEVDTVGDLAEMVWKAREKKD